jgi:phosphoenolpyruvate synthase/pyruvate phosphate dikinase
MSITKLADVRKEDVGTVGGKAANLGELIHMGMPVPEGFVITALTYPTFYRDIRESYRELGAEFVAVRSSGIAEDGLTASMAGQHDTYLGCTEVDLMGRVDDCFRSANNPRAIAYREENGITEDRIAVIVQRMIDPLYSGVLFTADPVDGDTTKMVVEWVEGTGEKLVSGEVIPNSAEIHDVGHLRSIRLDLFDIPNVKALAQAARDIEDHFGCPQDIEWCVDKEYKLWILQARPITTL